MTGPTAHPPPTAEFLAESKSSQTLAAVIIFPVLALIVVALRLYTRLKIVNNLSHDDFAVSVAMVFSIGCAVCQGLQVHNGTGKHTQAMSLSEAVVTMKALFASILLYNFGLTLTKISILLQYLRIAIGRPVRIACWCFLWFVVLYCIETFFAGVFQCIPVAKFWNQGLPGKCVDTTALYYANAGVNIAQDLLLVVFPFFILRKLIMPRREKLMLIFVLGLGGVATIASVFRLHALYILDVSEDVAWDSPGPAVWSAVELNVGILCTSLPTLRALLVRYWPRALLSSFSNRGRGGESIHTAKGQYYNMEGSIMVKKTIVIDKTLDLEAGDVQGSGGSSSHVPRTENRGVHSESSREITALPIY